MEKVKNIKNRSSILKIILSEYDSEYIKEVKIRYEVKGEIDTFRVKKMEYSEDGKIIFREVETASKNKGKFEITCFENGGFRVEKRKDQRIYEIYGHKTITKNGETKIVMRVEDKKEIREEEIGKRTLNTSTETLLLMPKNQEVYGKILKKEPCLVTSKDIYKAKRFLSYRSDMLIYLNFINDFLVKGMTKKIIENGKEKEKGLEIFNLKKVNISEKFTSEMRDGYLGKIVERFRVNISEFLTNYENRRKGISEKVEKEKKKGNRGNKNIRNLPKVLEISDKEILEDIEKIIEIYGKQRDSIMHYDYHSFENLYLGKNNGELGELLNLNMFKYLNSINDLKEEMTTNYLDKESRIRILKKDRGAINFYNIYYKLCNRKNGFNNFINSLLNDDGVEDKEFKDKIIDKYEGELNYLSKNTKMDSQSKQRLEELKKLKIYGIFPYIENIQRSKKYKKKYNDHKTLTREVNELILNMRGNKSGIKKLITDKNKEIKRLKNEMKDITSINSKYRLEVKLQLAFGFLKEEYGLNILKFRDDFNKSKEEKINNFIKKKEKYLCSKMEKENKELSTENIEEQVRKMPKINIYKENNNLANLNILTYLLLPREIKGDFLGFTKKSYYDFKNVEFVGEESDVDEVFSSLRLFEKNSKKLEIINYPMMWHMKDKKTIDFREFYRDLGIDLLDELGEKKLNLDVNVILPIFKYFKIGYKLYNDFELGALLKLSREKGLEIEEYIKEEFLSNDSNNLNMSDLMEKTINTSEITKKKRKKSMFGRNATAHFDYNDMFLEISSTKDKKQGISQKMEDFIKAYRTAVEDELKNLGYNAINDFYMKKERFIHHLEKSVLTEDKNAEKSILNERSIEVAKRYNLGNLENITSEKLSEIGKLYKFGILELEKEELDVKKLKEKFGEVEFSYIAKIYNKKKRKNENKSKTEKLKEIYYTNTEKTVGIKGALYSELSVLLGIYKYFVIKNIKSKIMEILSGESKKKVNFVFRVEGEDKREVVKTTFEYKFELNRYKTYTKEIKGEKYKIKLNFFEKDGKKVVKFTGDVSTEKEIIENVGKEVIKVGLVLTKGNN